MEVTKIYSIYHKLWNFHLQWSKHVVCDQISQMFTKTGSMKNNSLITNINAPTSLIVNHDHQSKACEYSPGNTQPEIITCDTPTIFVCSQALLIMHTTYIITREHGHRPAGNITERFYWPISYTLSQPGQQNFRRNNSLRDKIRLKHVRISFSVVAAGSL